MHRFELQKKDKKRIHVWAIVDHDFKFKLFFYFISTNQNEKMINRIYINLLKRFDNITNWLIRNDDFVFKKNRDSNHDINKNNKIRIWKIKLF